MSLEVLVIVSMLLVAGCWTDLRTMRIPNGLNVVFAAGGIVYQLLGHGIGGAGWGLTGALAGLVPLYIMNRFGGIGGGDVKWFGAFGIWAGPYITLKLLVLSILFAGGIACLLLLLRLPGINAMGRKLKWPWGAHPLAGGKAVQIPFMLAVAPGFITLLARG